MNLVNIGRVVNRKIDRDWRRHVDYASIFLFFGLLYHKLCYLEYLINFSFKLFCLLFCSLLLDKTVDNNPIEFLSTDQLVQLDPSTVQSSVQLSCTVNNNVGYGVVHAVRQQKTQTSLSRLSADDNGIYKCSILLSGISGSCF